MPHVNMQRKIPIVDIGQLGLTHEKEPSDLEWQRVGKEISVAFRDIGFVYLTQHGIPDDQLDSLVKAGATFFGLPQSKKDLWQRDPEKQQGYVAINRERFDSEKVHELREAYDVKRIDGIFPDSVVPQFRAVATDFLNSCKTLTKRILTAMAIGLDLEKNFFVNTHQEMCSDDNATALRLLHYPPVPSDVPPNAIRCGTHTDYGTITLLFQDDLGGLYVRDRSGKWLSADPIPGTILVNVGDLLQYWTADQFVATAHRVLIPEEEVRQKRSRRSIAFFVHPDNPVLIKPLNGSSDYQPVTALDHVLKRFSETYQY